MRLWTFVTSHPFVFWSLAAVIVLLLVGLIRGWGEDYPNRGPDARRLGKLGGYIQAGLSFKSTKPPKGLRIPIGSGHVALVWPPFLSIFIPVAKRRWASFRAGLRWDHNWPGYIADVIIKLRINNVVKPF